MAKLLPKLSDLPKAAEEKARTEADLRTEIRSLRAQLKAQPAVAKEVVVADQKAMERAIGPLVALVEDAVKLIVRVNAVGFSDSGLTPEQINEALKATAKEIQRAGKMNLQQQSQEFERLKTDAASLLKRMSARLADKNVMVDLTVKRNEPVSVAASRPAPRPSVPLNVESNGNLNGPQRKILKALAELLTIGKDTPPKSMVAAWAGYSVEGGAFGNPIGALKSQGLVDYPSPGFVSLTEEGAAAIGPVNEPTSEEIRHRIESICSGPERKIIAVLLDNGEGELAKSELASRAGYSEIGGVFGNPLGALRTKGLIDYPRPGVVKPSDWLFW